MTEAQEQEFLFQAARYDKRCKLLHATPNEGKRTAWNGLRFKLRGLMPGFPDISLPTPSPNGFHGLYIELKRKKVPAKLTASQRECIFELNRAGNYACVCYGWDVAWQTIQQYLAGEIPIDTTVFIRK